MKHKFKIRKKRKKKKPQKTRRQDDENIYLQRILSSPLLVFRETTIIMQGCFSFGGIKLNSDRKYPHEVDHFGIKVRVERKSVEDDVMNALDLVATEEVEPFGEQEELAEPTEEFVPRTPDFLLLQKSKK